MQLYVTDFRESVKYFMPTNLEHERVWNHPTASIMAAVLVGVHTSRLILKSWDCLPGLKGEEVVCVWCEVSSEWFKGL